ncbi:MAG: metalloprotease [Egibacteraceae bacterium]
MTDPRMRERPSIAAEVEITDPTPGRGDAIVFSPSRNQYLRLAAPQAAFLSNLDGRYTIAELEGDRRGRLPDGMVRPLLIRFAELGLLEGDRQPGGPPGGWWLDVTDLSAIRLSLPDPDGLLNRLVPLVRALGGPFGRIVSALAILIGLPSIVVNASAGIVAVASDGFTEPAWAGTLIAALLVSAMLHELGHAAAVKYYGGRVRQMGFMIFYLAPALFCDASDAWRFPHKHQRAVVGMAGIWVQTVLAGLAGIALWLPVDAAAAAWLVSFALFNLGLSALNLIPFIRLDGYWVLAALTDVPNLRSRALRYVAGFAWRLVAGVPRPGLPPPVHPVLTVLFGLGCVLFPPILILTVLLDYQHALLRLGSAGAAAWLLLAAGIVTVAVNRLLRAARSSRARDLPTTARWRAALAGSVAIFVAASLLTVLSVPTWFWTAFLQPAVSTLLYGVGVH